MPPRKIYPTFQQAQQRVEQLRKIGIWPAIIGPIRLPNTNIIYYYLRYDAEPHND